ncbi:MAG: long-chain fatty acid--CoA ligase [Rhodospirillales bacterium]
MFFAQAERFGARPFLFHKQDGIYVGTTWKEAADRSLRLAAGLSRLGVGPGDRIVLVSENRPEWLIADMAIMSLGAITVPAYTTNTVDDHRHVLTDSAAKGVLVSTERLAGNVVAAIRQAPSVEFIASMEKLGIMDLSSKVQGMTIDTLETDERTETVREGLARLKRDDLACIIYTSGTGGTPKGVMLHHGAILHNCSGALDALDQLGIGDDRFLSFLPLSHSYEHMAGQFFPIAAGAQIYYAESVETLISNLAEVQPTIMTAVPRLYETMHQRITRGVAKQGGVKELLFHMALNLGIKRYMTGGRLSMTERLLDALVDKLVRDKVRGRFGGQLKALVSGGAPLNPDIGLFFTALGLRILQGYGQTESAPVISVNRPNSPRIETVGPPIINTEVRIAEDGEILCRGELVMKGYWNNDEATAEAIRDGWLHTGDIGVIDPDGHLRITDRKKDIIVNSGGDNVAPQRVEGIISVEPEIAQAMVYGDKRPHLVALLVPDQAWLEEWCRGNGKNADMSKLGNDPELHAALAQVIDRVNSSLSSIEKVRRFMVAEEPFSIENEEMTPTMKVRRHKVRARYGNALEALYR